MTFERFARSLASSTLLAVLLHTGCSSAPSTGETPAGATQPGDVGAGHQSSDETAPEPAQLESPGQGNGGQTQEALPAIDEERETDSIMTVIEQLENSYRTGDYEQWAGLLTAAYKRRYSDPQNLAAEGWRARDLRSFFNLLVRTRQKENIGSLEISRVEFVSENKAYVYVLLEGEEFPVPQHTFIRRGDSWYKGLKEEDEHAP